MTVAALQYDNSFNVERWLGRREEKHEINDDSSWKNRREQFRQAEIEDLAKHAEALANNLEANRDQINYVDAVEFFEMYERVLELKANTLSGGSPSGGSPYWQISEYSDEEIAAIREADKLDPDLAEYYKDLLGD